MIRRFDKFYRKHPRIAASLMILACFVCLYAAKGADEANDTALRLQMWSSTGKGA